MKMKTGFTAIELLIGLGLSTIIISSATVLVYQYLQQNSDFQLWADAQSEGQLIREDFNKMFRNSVRLEPPEDLQSSGDGDYLGITTLTGDLAPSVCDATQSVLRLTSFERNKKSVRLLRAWDEMSNGDKNGAPNELRVYYDASEAALFQKNSGPSELTIVDADQMWIRRYKVKKYRFVRNTPYDPQDDLSKIDTNGKSKTFDYVSVDLEMPKNQKDNSITKQNVRFITGSEALPTKTSVLCKAKTDGSLIEINQSEKTTTTLLKNPIGKYSVTDFMIHFASPKAKAQLQDSDFKVTTQGKNGVVCANSAKISLILNPENLALDQESRKNILKPIVSTKLLFLTNFSVKRPANCY